MTMEKKRISCRKMEKFAIFMVWLISFNTNAFSASHFFKLPISYSSSTKIMKCTFNLQNDGYCLKWRRWKNRKKVSWWFFVCLYSLSQIFNAINDNCRVWFSDSRFMFHDSSWSFYESVLAERHISRITWREQYKIMDLNLHTRTKLLDNVIILKTFLSTISFIIQFFIKQRFRKHHFLQGRKQQNDETRQLTIQGFIYYPSV